MGLKIDVVSWLLNRLETDEVISPDIAYKARERLFRDESNIADDQKVKAA